ncbi:RhoGAP domain-containing protein [Hamiltosporidium magnivora]|uniref:RhoGAP domain-containing protein n=1 Tax=Hamiltosporidium magnivora TaxID=148818 RepID=A0A4Q9KY56_9MICR|nr:RhoGAP domain-containing protein [Hamiltosporidium magnivora]
MEDNDSKHDINNSKQIIRKNSERIEFVNDNGKVPFSDVNIRLVSKTEAENNLREYFKSVRSCWNVWNECFKFLYLNNKKFDESQGVILEIFNYLLQNGLLKSIGLFRKACLIEQMKIVVENIKQGKVFDFRKFTEFELCNGIKYFIRVEMDGILGLRIYENLLNADSFCIERNPRLLLICIASMMKENISFFFLSILRILGCVARYDTNRMDSKALSIIFCPVLIGETILKKMSVEHIRKFSHIFESFIEIFDVHL